MATILVIDDEQHIRTSIVDVLQYEKFACVQAENGRQGIRLAKEYRPDLVLCDITMSDITGYEVLIELRRHPATSTIPFIFLSGKTDKDDIRKGMNLGADDYLTKPFSVSDLLSAIHTRMEKHVAVVGQLEELRVNLSRNVPHEFRTPLSNILGFSELLMSLNALPGQSPVDPSVFDMASSIHQSAERLHRIIENYLLYSDLMLAKYQPHRTTLWHNTEWTNTKSLITYLALQEAQYVQRQNDLIFALVDVETCISEACLHKIIIELLANALKFSDPGTPIMLVTYVDGDQFTLSVIDQGRGMAAEEIASIGAYMQFRRDQYEQQGIGLGLILCRLLAELHYGELTIESQPNNGTTINIVFPHAQEHTDQKPL